jgi:SSS family solute:Na+ symporter
LFAAALKLIIPFVIVIPGIIAFNLYSTDLAEIDQRKNAVDWTAYEEHLGDSNSGHYFEVGHQWGRFNAEALAALNAHNVAVLEANGGNVDDLQHPELSGREIAALSLRLDKIDGLTKHSLLGYKYDASLNLLIKNLLPENSGLRGFIIAALFGAIVSSLAAVLNAASTIFTMDIFVKYVAPDASQKALVKVGRVAVGVFAITGCLMAPNLDKLGSIFEYIQMFQGYASPGILAVFVFGILNRKAPGIAGVVGLVLNPILYWALDKFTDIAFLDAMGICFFGVMAVMWVIGAVRPLATPVEFQVNTRLSLESSASAKKVGVGVVVLTLVLYVIFSPLGIAG